MRGLRLLLLLRESNQHLLDDDLVHLLPGFYFGDVSVCTLERISARQLVQDLCLELSDDAVAACDSQL